MLQYFDQKIRVSNIEKLHQTFSNLFSIFRDQTVAADQGDKFNYWPLSMNKLRRLNQ